MQIIKYANFSDLLQFQIHVSVTKVKIYLEISFLFQGSHPYP